ncbi:uncharacterized protein LOC127612976 [Hippocampus zosterae]|uniref:uncharacterized protein LOC127612976 n=1 Tax=Hippocampus zosterae TaxID=109293 RepID=UPI00223D254C|nr:uncharacterized protein LOC127612976 [Hippocampus zosterae]
MSQYSDSQCDEMQEHENVEREAEAKIRKSSRLRHLTPKMQELKEKEFIQKEGKLNVTYDKWKSLVRETRRKLKQWCPEQDMYDMMDEVEKLEGEIKEIYDSVRSRTTPSQELRRKVDSCAAATADLLQVMRIRLTEYEEDFDAVAENAKLHMLLDNEYARSIYGSTASIVTAPSAKPSGHPSESPSISVKRAEMAALLAAKEAEINMEEAIEAQRQQLKKLENRRDMEVIKAQLSVYEEEEIKERNGTSSPVHTKENVAFPSSHHAPRHEQQTVQNETTLVQILQESLALSRLPNPEPTVFSGDPLNFIEWSTSFKALIERRCSNPADRLFYLQKYIAGEAKSSLEGSFYRRDEEAYQQAWDRLNTRYGNSFIVQRAFREKLNGWPKIGGREYFKLREFSDFLQTCSNAMPYIKGLQVLNDCEENQKMLVKLPDWVTSRWNRHVTEQLDEGKDYPSFHNFATFISKEARIACNPVSSLYALRQSTEMTVKGGRQSKANTFATKVRIQDPQTSTADQDPNENDLRDAENPGICLCCGEEHYIHKCKKLMKMSSEEKRKYIYENKLCFACLRKGHNSKACRNGAMCGVCLKSHPTALHEDRSPTETASAQNTTEEITSSLSCCVKGSDVVSTSMIVPVWISAPNAPETETLAYALLDTQSSHTFVDQELCAKLKVDMDPVKLKLSTMRGKDSVIKSERVCGLKVRGFSSNISIDLPPAYTRDFIPLDRTHIPTRKTATSWKHLVNITQEIPPPMDCGVGLLIGYDWIPREVITGGDYEPYAVKTDLGWSIVGGVAQCVNAGDVTGLCLRVSVKELPPVTPSAIIKALESDFADTKAGEKSISQDDILFLQILKGGFQLNEHGHLEMPLPFKARPHLPNNKVLALARLKQLKRKLDRDHKFKGDYLKFMEGIIKDGDAEKVDNPADHASRGLNVTGLINSNWLTGPRFLWERDIAINEVTPELLVGDPEVRIVQVLKTEAVRQFDIQELLSRISKWATAFNVIARIQRLVKRIKTTKPVNVEEKRQATLTLVKLTQKDVFQKEMSMLSEKSGKLPCNHQLYQLDPCLQDVILRVGGRLRKAAVSLELKQPVILPKDGALRNLIISHHHNKIQHQGRGQTLNELRSNGFWIVGGSKAVAQRIRRCVQRRRIRAPPEEQRMADLPSDRVDATPPFAYCGMDCFGPFHTKQGRKEQKRYGLLFTCLCSRAVHIEMLEDMTTDAFINALRCFVAIRGAVRHIRSDQGTNFVGARNEMAKALKELNQERLASYLADKQCDFQMNTPHSSHTGGVWERQIRTVRSVLSTVLAQSAGRLNDSSLRTFFYEAMSIVNNRPLTVDNISDPTSLEPLTPNHLITMKSSLPLPPPGKFIQEDLYAKKRWRTIQYLSEQFWHRWRKEYLANLTLRQRWLTPRRNMVVGDVVIIKEDDVPRNEWKLAKVIEANQDDDGLVRKVTVQIGERKLGRKGERLNKPSVVQRAVQKLVVLVEGN